MADSCCNPFSLPGVPEIRIFAWSQNGCVTKQTFPWAQRSDSCRKEARKGSSMSPTECGSPTGEQYIDVPATVASVNSCLLEIGETPLLAAAKNSRQIESTMDRLAVAMKGLILEDSTNVDPNESDENEMILQLKEKFWETMKRSEQVQILTVLPRSWTRKRIQNEFVCPSTWLVRINNWFVKKLFC